LRDIYASQRESRRERHRATGAVNALLVKPPESRVIDLGEKAKLPLKG
jgi:hypothetical protein